MSQMQNMSTVPQSIKTAAHFSQIEQPTRQFCFLYIIAISLALTGNMASTIDASELRQSRDPHALSTLNIRLSSKVIRPPQDLVTATLNIPNINIARPIVGPPSKSAILEDDQRHRLVVLTAEDNGGLTAYMLDNIDLEPHLQDFQQQTIERGCARDRMTITGGLGCVALCLKNILESEILP